MDIDFVKMHGNGNDFILVDEYERIVIPDHMKGEFAATFCDRHFGIGGDGVLYMMRSLVADLRMRLFQPDQSEAEMFTRCMAGWWLVCRLVFGRVWLDPSVAVLTALLLNFTLKVWLVIEAGQQLAEDQRTGAFELLLSSPLTVRDILRGQLLALRRQFLRPLLVVLGVELLLTVAVHRRAPDWETLATWLAGMFMLVADLVALSWVAMWRALVAKSHNLATVSTLTARAGACRGRCSEP